jgi:hypothetical protein
MHFPSSQKNAVRIETTVCIEVGEKEGVTINGADEDPEDCSDGRTRLLGNSVGTMVGLTEGINPGNSVGP